MTSALRPTSPIPRHFCTYFDSNYLTRGLALYQSLVCHAQPFQLWVLCFDALAYEILEELDLPEIIPISLSDFEEWNPDFLQAKRNRSRIEYYFTSTPSLILYILESYPQVELLTYLDADLFFFSDPSTVYEELGNGSVLIVEHRFPSRLADRIVYGLYNVGFLAFRGNAAGLACLRWWRDRCLEWCYDIPEAGRFADQKYLDDWPSRFPGVVVVQHKGAGLAPWNLNNDPLAMKAGQVLVDSEPLVFFHFHNYVPVRRWLHDPGLRAYGIDMDPLVKYQIYGPYLRALHEAGRNSSFAVRQTKNPRDSLRTSEGHTGPARLPTVTHIRQLLSIVKRILRGDLWVVLGGRML